MILPAVDRAFEWRTVPGGPALASPLLERHAAHFFTTRVWTLGFGSNQLDDDQAWHQVAASAGVAEDRLIRLRQVHGAEVVEARPGAPMPTGDIVIADDPTLAIAVQTADCVPLLIADTRSGAVCAAHAGWRGMAARVPQVAVAALVGRCGSRFRDLVAAIGPSIGACCYEVGDDVRTSLQTLASDVIDPSTWFHARPAVDPDNPSLDGVPKEGRADRWYFDGWACGVAQLLDAGLIAERIVVARSCTASHPSAFCSYRRDGAPAGRLAAVIRPGAHRQSR